MTTINVTQDDIDNGLPHRAMNCPVALALTRLTGQEAVVGHIEVLVGDDYNGELPEHASAFVRAFDDGETVESFTFELEGLTV